MEEALAVSGTEPEEEMPVVRDTGVDEVSTGKLVGTASVFVVLRGVEDGKEVFAVDKGKHVSVPFEKKQVVTKEVEPEGLTKDVVLLETGDVRVRIIVLTIGTVVDDRDGAVAVMVGVSRGVERKSLVPVEYVDSEVSPPSVELEDG